MRVLRRDASGIDFVVSQQSREAMIAAVADGEIDMAFGVFPTLPSRCEADTLFEDAYVCVPLASSQGCAASPEQGPPVPKRRPSARGPLSRSPVFPARPKPPRRFSPRSGASALFTVDR